MRDVIRAASNHARQYNRSLTIMLIPILAGLFPTKVNYGPVDISEPQFLQLATLAVFALLYVSINARIKNIIAISTMDVWARSNDYGQIKIADEETEERTRGIANGPRSAGEVGYKDITMLELMRTLTIGSFANNSPVTHTLSKIAKFESSKARRFVRTLMRWVDIFVLSVVPFAIGLWFFGKSICDFNVSSLGSWIVSFAIFFEIVVCTLALCALFYLAKEGGKAIGKAIDAGTEYGDRRATT